MTLAQRRLVWEWAASILLLAAIALLTGPLMKSWAWLKWCALVFALVMRALMSQSYAAREGNNIIAETVAAHPWLNWWAAVSTVLIVSTAFSSIETLSHIPKAAVLRWIFLAVGIAFGPALILVERRRYQERA